MYMNSFTMMEQNVFCNPQRSHYEGVTRQTTHPQSTPQPVTYLPRTLFLNCLNCRTFCPTSTIWPRSFHQFKQSASDLSSPLYWWWVGENMEISGRELFSLPGRETGPAVWINLPAILHPSILFSLEIDKKFWCGLIAVYTLQSIRMIIISMSRSRLTSESNVTDKAGWADKIHKRE